MRQAVFKHGAEADEMDEHRLAVAAVTAVAGMLGHVGVNDNPVGRGVAEALRLVRLHLTKGLPAAG
jgi:hypothetical protein